MRRASICLAVLGLFVLSLPAMASAEEITVSISKFKAKAVPIPKPGGGSFKGTGNFYGKGAAVEAEYEFEGSGYGATPQNPKGGIPPISAVNFFLPKGTKLHPQGFGKCTEEALKSVGPSACPKNSIASSSATNRAATPATAAARAAPLLHPTVCFLNPVLPRRSRTSRAVRSRTAPPFDGTALPASLRGAYALLRISSCSSYL